MYGNGRPEFKKTVDSILDEINGSDVGGYYCLKENIYVDSQRENIRILKPEEKVFYLEKAKEFVNTITKGEEIPCYTKTMLRDIERYYRHYSSFYLQNYSSNELESFYPEFEKQKCYLYKDKRNHRVLNLRINDAELKMKYQILNKSFGGNNPIENITRIKWFKNPELPKDITAKASQEWMKTGLFDNEPYMNKILYGKEFLDFLRQKFDLDPNTKIKHQSPSSNNFTLSSELNEQERKLVKNI